MQVVVQYQRRKVNHEVIDFHPGFDFVLVANCFNDALDMPISGVEGDQRFELGTTLDKAAVLVGELW